jgi:tetratricopeptide (TPR) repeat protein
MKTLLKRFAGVALVAWLAFFAAMAAPAFAASNDEAESIALKPDFAMTYSNLGFTYNRTGAYDKTVECCTKAITLKPDYAEPYFNRAVALEKLGRLKEAKLDYAKACALNPSNADYADDKRRSENW